MNNSELSVIVNRGEVIIEQSCYGVCKNGTMKIAEFRYHLDTDEARDLINMLEEAIMRIEEI